LAPVSWAEVLAGDNGGSCPFSGIVVCDTASRAEHIRRGLIARAVYPAVLWPLERPFSPAIPAEDRQLSARLLSIHCDMRYATDDMDRVADLIIELGATWR
jgi:hypothetical protein